MDSLTMATRNKVIAEASRALANAALVLADALEADAPEAAPAARAVRAPEAAEVMGALPGPGEPPHGHRYNAAGMLERI